jgi:hypothetical protein
MKQATRRPRGPSRSRGKNPSDSTCSQCRLGDTRYRHTVSRSEPAHIRRSRAILAPGMARARYGGMSAGGAGDVCSGVTAGDGGPSFVTLPGVDAGDLMIRNVTYRLFVDFGRAPSTGEVAAAVAVDGSEVRASWARLHDAHAIVLDAETGGMRMANPFSAVPTSFRVRTSQRWWYANCAWDAFGICPRHRRRHRNGLRRLRRRHRLRGPGRPSRRRHLGFPLFRAGRRMVGRHRVHVKHHEPLPVGRARDAMAGR